MGSIIPAAGICASALTAERTRMHVISSNIANQATTRDVDGQTYRRKQVIFETMVTPNDTGLPQQASPSGVRIARIMDDPRPFKEVHMPGHQDADANGIVKMPNVSVIEEMVDMMNVQRSFEANTQVLTTGKQMFSQSLRIGD